MKRGIAIYLVLIVIGGKMQERLKFYTITDEYIQYLSDYDKHVSWNKEQKRPYIGVVLKVEEKLYFAPLYSYKLGYERYKNNPSFMRVKNKKKENVAIIRFAEMIPVPKSEVTLLDFEARGEKYKDLLQSEFEFINNNKESIYNKANKIYKNVKYEKIPFYINISCNFELLEQKSEYYSKV